MKFSIRAILALTLLIALLVHAFIRWNRLDTIRAEIVHWQRELIRQPFNERHVQAHTAICESAIADTPLPSLAYQSAEANYGRQNPGKEFGRDK